MISFENFKWPKHWQKKQKSIQQQQMEQIAPLVRYALVLAAARRGHAGQTQHGASFLPWQRDGWKTQTTEEEDALTGLFPPPLWKH